jgi:hypothetical protein
MRNSLLIIAATTLLVACGGGSSSSSKTPSDSQTPTTTTGSGDCQVVNEEIVIAEGESCNINAATKTQYSLFFDGVTECSNGKIVTTGLTGTTVVFNGLTIKCK